MSSKISMKRQDALKLSQIYNELFLDGLEAVRKLRVVNEGIQFPTIVVIGDQSSGKSSVLESLTGISLPTGKRNCTRVILIMRLQRCSKTEDCENCD